MKITYGDVALEYSALVKCKKIFEKKHKISAILIVPLKLSSLILAIITLTNFFTGFIKSQHVTVVISGLAIMSSILLWAFINQRNVADIILAKFGLMNQLK